MAVFLFHGADTYSQREKLDFWHDEFQKKYGGDMNVSVLSGKDSTANQIFQNCAAMPFLSEKRLVVVKNFLSDASEEERTALTEMVEGVPDFCVLVFSEMEGFDKRINIYKKLQKIAKVVEFPAIVGSKLLGWIEKRVESGGGKMEKDAVIYLAELVAGDLYKMGNEVAKLVAYAGERPVTKADIDLLVDTQLDTSIFRLTDGVGQKNKKVALDTLHQLIESGEELHGILYMIMRQFRIIMGVKDLMSQGLSRDGIVAKLHEHPFVVSNTMSQAKNFSIEQLKRAYKLLIDIDTRLKSGGIKVLAGDNREFVLALDKLVLDLCR